MRWRSQNFSLGIGGVWGGAPSLRRPLEVWERIHYQPEAGFLGEKPVAGG